MQGGLMAARVFDTYMPGGEDPLINFVNSISDGRILCLAIMVSCLSRKAYHNVCHVGREDGRESIFIVGISDSPPST